MDGNQTFVDETSADSPGTFPANEVALHVHAGSLTASEPTPVRRRPRAAAIADWVTFALLILAISAAAFGGFRAHIFGVPVYVKGWLRPTLLAALIVAVRHWYLPSPTMFRVWADRWAAIWQTAVGHEVAPVFLATRLGVLLAGYMAVTTLGLPQTQERVHVFDNRLEDLVARWDVSWYLSIVSDGYRWDGHPEHQQNVVFFPAFPAVTYAAGLFLGKRWLLAGLVVALGAFFVALTYLFRLARELIDEDGARMTIWLLAAYPFSVYYSVPYTESFYLLGSVGAFWEATQGRWLRAALFGYFVALCRPNGFLIALPIAILAAPDIVRGVRAGAVRAAPWAAVLAPIAGILTYSAFLYLRFGDPFVWREGQLAWGRAYVGVWRGLSALWLDRYQAIGHDGLFQYSMNNPYDLMYTIAAVFALVSVVPTVRRFGLAYGAFTLVNLAPPLLVGGMMSIGRMTSVLFPVFLWLAAAMPRRYLMPTVAMFCVLQGLVAVLFFGWRPIF
jgi:hypothetical protein